jgi:two-component system alkaline phosphatase synthesis response regulator PhoP
MNNLPKILVVEDEKDLCEILEFNLAPEGFDVHVVYSAEEGLKQSLEDFDLILLDVMLSGMSGYKMADYIRKEKKLSIPIIFLTAKVEEIDMLTGFRVGGDDYITKPFSVKEVIARIKAILKRSKTQASRAEIIAIDGLKIDTEKKQTTIDGQSVLLTRKEFEILLMLIKHQGKYISREEILQQIWGKGVIVLERNVDVNIARLRKKLANYGACIKGRTGYGYCFEA